MVVAKSAMPIIRRNVVTLSSEGRASRPVIHLTNALPKIEAKESKRPSTALVINASIEMARELTYQLSQAIPDCAILFAPTLSLALWILKRRDIDLIISSAMVPDGSLHDLDIYLEQLSDRPELLIVGDIESSREQITSHPGYRFAELRRVKAELQNLKTEPQQSQKLSPDVTALGADIRNDLNNPLQEIVAMAFVAHSSEGLSSTAEMALAAIQKAALGMSAVVNKLEEKIRKAVAA